ncbi:MAG: hypothetical protein WAW36_02035 [Methylovulum miyakonense]
MFIGQNIKVDKACQELDACLLTDAEFSVGKSAWESYQDDFPAWLLDEPV